jgi:hypothetical protein
MCISDETVKSTYTGQVISMRQDFESFMEDPKGLILSDAMVETFLGDDGCGGLMFEITLLRHVNRLSIGRKRTHPH